MTIGIMADVKRFAVHDGPGIRTTLFLKGCSLSCKWCHNPEMEHTAPELAFFGHKCIGCGVCTSVCQSKVHSFQNRKHEVDRSKCTFCGKCVSACPAEALRIYGRKITPEDAEKLLLEDVDFYGMDGGITVSGGEPLLQADFCAELFQILKHKNIHIAVDTCGDVPWQNFEQVLPYADIYLYDFKEADSGKHKKFTGSGNERILENLRKLDAAGKSIEIRMVQIPHWNMEQCGIWAAAEILSGLKYVTGIRLLPYLSLARSKYAAIGCRDTMPKVETPDIRMLWENAEILQKKGLRVLNDFSRKDDM